MNKTIISTLSAVMIASIAFGTAARAEGDYYEGASKNKSNAVDTINTASISLNSASADHQAATINSGDYYDGANRPN